MDGILNTSICTKMDVWWLWPEVVGVGGITFYFRGCVFFQTQGFIYTV